jgi:hypothetical protein
MMSALHYGHPINYLSIQGTRDWEQQNLARIQNCRKYVLTQAKKKKNCEDHDLAIYLHSPGKYVLSTAVTVELIALFKEMASCERKLTVLFEKDLDHEAIHFILFMGNHLNLIRGLETATIHPWIIGEIAANPTLRYLGLELLRHDDDDDDDDGQEGILLSQQLGDVLAVNTSVRNLYLKVSEPAAIAETFLIQLGQGLKANKCVQNLSVTFSQPELFWLFDAIKDHPTIRALTLTYLEESQLHNVMVDNLIPFLSTPTTCRIKELELSGLGQRTQNPAFLMDLLLPGLIQNRSLNRLALPRNNLSTKEVDELLSCLWECAPTVKILDLEHNNITSLRFDKFLLQQQSTPPTSCKLEQLRLGNNPFQRDVIHFLWGHFRMLHACPRLYSFGWTFDSLWNAVPCRATKNDTPLPSKLQSLADVNQCRSILVEIETIAPELLPLILQRVKQTLQVFSHNRRQANILFHLIQRNPAILQRR